MKIKIWFTDFWDDFNPYDNFFTKLLSKYYDLDITPSNPDFLIFSWCLKDFYNYKNCVRIYFTGENIRPDYSICDYSISFDYDSFDKRNLRLPLYVLYGEKEKLIKLKSVEQIAVEKTKFCNFIYSNERAKERKEFFDILNRYKKVDSGGKVFNNIGYRVDKKLDFIKDYKFTIAFENSSYRGYTTEKIFEPMMVQSIPIYWGNPNIKEDFNIQSFINVHDYGSLKEVVEKIKEIDTNKDLYLKMLREPFLLKDKKTDYFSEQRILNFFDKIFSEKKITRTQSIHATKDEVKISVIVPVYNTSQYLSECLNSILSQNFIDFEVICVNDGSTDDSATILEKFSKENDSIKVFYQDNQGLSAARNKGLSEATGKYIVFVDSDDILLPQMLEKTYTKAEEMELEVLGFNFTEDVKIDTHKKTFSADDVLVDGQYYFLHYYIENKDFPSSSSCSYIYNRKFLNDNNLQFKEGIYHEDEHFFVRMIILVRKMAFINQDLYYYRTSRTDSITNKPKLKNSVDLKLICRDLFYYLRYNQCNESLFYRKIFQLYLTSVLYAIEGDYIKSKAMQFTLEDKIILRACIQNYNHFYYYSLLTKNVKLFKLFVIDKKPFLFAKVISILHKIYYKIMADKYRKQI